MDVVKEFGSLVFNEQVMRERLPKDIYKALRHTMQERRDLDIEIANVVASAMKDWAVEKGATHYTHWFQPMTGITAEKHEGFITPCDDGKVIMEFSGKELVKGEPDASSFPSGGIRATFEARGYTAWDPTSYAFIKGKTLCIPTAFCSFSGEALDKKTPLLRSMQAISREAMRVIRLFGDGSITDVTTTVGAEQEYFLIDETIYKKRPDLVYCGRTLFGARPSKGQEMDDHYFGVLKPRVAAFMDDLDEELWKLGVVAKTKHNEVAPGQHELAPMFSTTNIATDHNQLVMEIIKTVAKRHGLVCLLHEKPFAGVNGSGKHNNWSMNTNTGENLLDPGDTPSENARFLLMLAAVIKAVDEYQDLLRISVATPGNDCRLGGDEAPPAIISIFLGDELTSILECIKEGKPYDGHAGGEKMEIGVDALPHFPKDTSDRNRTSPFAFTGNKFEFRMPGSSVSIAGPNFIINTIVAESLSQFADELEKADDFKSALSDIVKRTMIEHDRIIFNGNNYSDEWVKEAQRRGLLNLKSSVDALELFSLEKNIRLFEKHGVLTRSELLARQEIMLEICYKTTNIEALTMLDIAKQQIVPAVIAYMSEVSGAIIGKRSVDEGLGCKLETSLLEKLSALSDKLCDKIEELEVIVETAKRENGVMATAKVYHDGVLAKMQELRETVDALEMLTKKDCWPLPSYGDILYSVK